MALHFGELGDVAVVQVARNTHALWGDGAALDHYATLLRAQRDRSGGRMQLWGACENAEVLASLKRYALAMRLGPRVLSAVGIGAVFTAPQARGRGLARRLLRRVLLDAQQRGVHAALLFSDIDPAFYAALGFAQLPALSWGAATAALPTSGGLALRPAADATALLTALQRRGSASDELARARDGLGWYYWRWRHGVQHTLLLERDGVPAGYLCATVDAPPAAERGAQPAAADNPRRLWIHELVTAGVARDAVHATLGALARRLDAASVTGWLRPEHARGPFHAQARRGCLPMLAWLCHAPPPVGAVRLSALDRF